ncbi:ABC transporter ATP-binding protein [bacterium C-53]|nr:ABC transporter ATP-binding protein [Lachnospiraceae bacterium]NBI01510.1 ABC transporter ATP-binding protein [Lachnospiraceae bacterium]RKJ12816.1 ABC transporter ATP-binding protein [bacterium C-53]
MEEIAIQVESLDKVYKLYDKPMDRLRESLGLSRKRKLYKEHYALRDVNLSVKKGETVGIIGTNGSGKSTILKIITGVLNPTMGNVKINGRISALLELGAGFNMEFTGVENVYLNGTMIGFSKAEIDAKLQDILDFADIGDFVYQKVKTYSSGMFVRLAFAVAINIEPEILIVDEALSVGDVFFQNKCYHKFEEFKAQGRTILFVSHDLSSISKYCDRVILLERGRKLGEGKPKEMIDMYKKVLVHQLDDNAMNQKSVQKSGGNAWKDKMVQNPDQDVYGNGLAEFVDFCIVDNSGNITNTIIKGEPFTVKVKVRFSDSVSEPIIAVSYKNRLGVEITGTNTMFEKISTGTPKNGDVMVVSFTQKMSLQGGEYLISLGCTGYRGGEFTVYHRMYDVFNIQVISSKDTTGYYDMDSDTEVELFESDGE